MPVRLYRTFCIMWWTTWCWKVIEYKILFLIFFPNFFWNILRRNKRNVIKNVHWSSSKVPVILVRFQWNLNLMDIFSRNIQIQNFMKIRPVEDEIFFPCGRTDGHGEGNIRFSQFCESAWKTKQNNSTRHLFFYRCTVHFVVYLSNTPTNAHI